MLAQTLYIPVHTGRCKYIPILSGAKKVQTRFKPVIFCILFACLTTALQEHKHHVSDMKHTENLVSMYLVLLCLPVNLALDDGSPAPIPLLPRLQP